MTYILGVRCTDGIVLIADRKIIINEGVGYIYGDKLYGDLGGIIIGFSGSKSTFELFRTEIIQFVNEYRKDYNEGVPIHKLILQISEVSYKLSNKYRTSNDSFDILIAVSGTHLPNLVSNPKYVYQDGRIDNVDEYESIGTGWPYGMIYLKQNWHGQTSMKEAAALGHFIIKYIERFELDLSVGTGKNSPQIWFVPNNQNDYLASPQLLEELDNLTTARIDIFKKQNYAKLQ